MLTEAISNEKSSTIRISHHWEMDLIKIISDVPCIILSARTMNNYKFKHLNDSPKRHFSAFLQEINVAIYTIIVKVNK